MRDKLHILHLEDNSDDTDLMQRQLDQDACSYEITRASSASEFQAAFGARPFDVILSDSAVCDLEGLSALKWVREQGSPTPFIFVSGNGSADRIRECLSRGAAAFVPKDHLEELTPSIQRALAKERSAPAPVQSPTDYLVTVIQDLSLTRSLDEVMEIVRHAARRLVGADGATFVLRDGDQCHYAEEDAIAPLWKGCRFPLTACVSGWAMLNKQHAAIEDIYADPRIPADAYRPTFVKSLVMVPIRTAAPIGAIGTYWATRRQASPAEIKLLRALADSTSIAIENVQLYAELEQRVRDRTSELHVANKELEAFSYSVSHDLRAPLRAILGFSKILMEDNRPQLDATGVNHLTRIVQSGERMSRLIEDLLKLASMGRQPMIRETIDLSRMAEGIFADLRETAPERKAEVVVAKGIIANGDSGLLRVVVDNLLSNAWKYSSKKPDARLEMGMIGDSTYFVRDNGAGFDPAYAKRLFGVFQRLHHEQDFPGTGIGLATAQRIINRHGGRIWAESSPGQGATFFFTLSGAGSGS